MNTLHNITIKHLASIGRHCRRLLVGLAFIACHLSLSQAVAQTFTQRIQKPQQGQGTVTIHQSDDIERLVNDPAATGVQPQRTAPQSSPSTAAKQPAATSKQPTTQTSTQTSTETTAADGAEAQPKAVRGTHKVNGYRVQAYAGGNSRADRQTAERIGNNIRSQFAGVPVYVHFYSPRWICRVGNYRTYEEAHKMMVSLQQMGYKQATIVKGKISVAY